MRPIDIVPARPVTSTQAALERKAGQLPARSSEPDGARSSDLVSGDFAATLDPGEPPVDADRVELIRKAVESGDYSLVPTRIADAMIAAGALLRNPKS